MNSLHLTFAVGLAVVLSFAVTRLVELHSANLGLTQTPNERSSHTRPTASGGGVGPAIVGVSACVLLALPGEWQFGILAVLAAVIALLGFVDDLLDLSARLRFVVQAFVVASLLIVFSPLPELILPFGFVLGSLPLLLVLAVAGLWWINLFNFMDGIDGIAASQTVLILLGAALIWLWHEPGAYREPVFALLMLIAAAATGFLFRNWPPARIFMGDAGSNFFAFVTFATALMTASSGVIGIPVWLILVGAFTTDATVTLLRRVARGERAWVAHRRHAYQQLSRKWGHGRTTLSYAAITFFVLLPCAWIASVAESLSWAIVLICYTTLAFLMFTAGAGAAEERKTT